MYATYISNMLIKMIKIMSGLSAAEHRVSSCYILQYNIDATSLSVHLCQPPCVNSLQKGQQISGCHVTVKCKCTCSDNQREINTLAC